MVAQAGPVQLAQLVDAPWVGVFYALPLNAWELKTWDRFLIPKPFSRVVMTWPKRIPADEVTLLRVDRATGAVADDHFRNLPEHLRAGDLLVLNDSRVLPARLYAVRAGLTTQASSPSPTGRIEVLLTQQLGPSEWSALVRPGRKVPVGETLLFPDMDGATVLSAEVLTAGEFGERTLRIRGFLRSWTALGICRSRRIFIVTIRARTRPATKRCMRLRRDRLRLRRLGCTLRRRYLLSCRRGACK
jgi:hypothetical protein